jgi:hypothetical protein
MATIYVETSVISLLTSGLSSNVVSLSRQILTREWWSDHRSNHDLFVSQFVYDEASRGDSELARQRLKVLEELIQLELTTEVIEVASELFSSGILPEKARLDALHISIASVHGVEYLLTWNCKHIANARILPALYRTLEGLGLSPPLVCTIEEMMGHGDSLE